MWDRTPSCDIVVNVERCGVGCECCTGNIIYDVAAADLHHTADNFATAAHCPVWRVAAAPALHCTAAGVSTTFSCSENKAFCDWWIPTECISHLLRLTVARLAFSCSPQQHRWARSADIPGDGDISADIIAAHPSLQSAWPRYQQTYQFPIDFHDSLTLMSDVCDDHFLVWSVYPTLSLIAISVLHWMCLASSILHTQSARSKKPSKWTREIV